MLTSFDVSIHGAASVILLNNLLFPSNQLIRLGLAENTEVYSNLYTLEVQNN